MFASTPFGRIVGCWASTGMDAEDHRDRATIHISAAEAARNFAGLLARVRAGAEIVIEEGSLTVAVLRTPAPPRRSIEECIALLPEDSPATVSTALSDLLIGVTALELGYRVATVNLRRFQMIPGLETVSL